MTATPICPTCDRGVEACEWCHNLNRIDFETICDCGLYDFDGHLAIVQCEKRAAFKWVVVSGDPHAPRAEP